MLQRQFGVAMLLHQLLSMRAVAAHLLGEGCKELLLKHHAAVLEARVWQGIVSVLWPPFICEDAPEHLAITFKLADDKDNRLPIPNAYRLAIDSSRKLFKALAGAELCALIGPALKAPAYHTNNPWICSRRLHMYMFRSGFMWVSIVMLFCGVPLQGRGAGVPGRLTPKCSSAHSNALKC